MILGFGHIFKYFLKKTFMLLYTKAQLFDKKYSKNSNIVKYFIRIFKNLINSCDGKAEFSASLL